MINKNTSVKSSLIKNSRLIGKIANILLPLMLGVVILILWQTEILHKIFNTDVFTLPLPSVITSYSIHYTKLYETHLY